MEANTSYQNSYSVIPVTRANISAATKPLVSRKAEGNQL